MSDSTTVQVYLGPRSYEIVIVSNALASFGSQLGTWLEERERQAVPAGTVCVVTDGNVEPHAAVVRESLAAEGWNVGAITFEPGERTKRMEVIEQAYEQLVAMGADRNSVVVAVGGGVVGDAAGFVAATFGRGVPFVQVPTTLLADVDSSVGGKVGINLPSGKNLVGAFHQPLGVFIDTATLATLPDREYRSGLAEIVKYGVIVDVGFLDLLERHVKELNARDEAILRAVIARSCRIKADVVERDEEERTGLRAILNYGHTFAHAFETLTGYGKLLHGEAVAIGMVCASRLAERRGLVSAADTERQVRLLEALGLPTTLPEDVTIDPQQALGCMRRDKKAVAGRTRFVLPTRLGHVKTFNDVPDEDVLAVLG